MTPALDSERVEGSRDPQKGITAEARMEKARNLLDGWLKKQDQSRIEEIVCDLEMHSIPADYVNASDYVDCWLELRNLLEIP